MNRTLLLLTILITISAGASIVSAANFEESIANGKSVYAKKCASCHGAKGEGGVGPALNSKSKLDSLGLENVLHTVEVGVPDTAMPAWKGQLTEVEIEDVVHFIFAEWAGLIIVGIELWPWEIAFVVCGAIWTIMGIYYVVRA